MVSWISVSFWQYIVYSHNVYHLVISVCRNRWAAAQRNGWVSFSNIKVLCTTRHLFSPAAERQPSSTHTAHIWQETTRLISSLQCELFTRATRKTSKMAKLLRIRTRRARCSLYCSRPSARGYAACSSINLPKGRNHVLRFPSGRHWSQINLISKSPMSLFLSLFHFKPSNQKTNDDQRHY